MVKTTSCTPQFCVPQPRCREDVLVLVLHPHCYALSQNRNPRKEHAKIKIIINIIGATMVSAAFRITFFRHPKKSKKERNMLATTSTTNMRCVALRHNFPLFSQPNIYFFSAGLCKQLQTKRAHEKTVPKKLFYVSLSSSIIIKFNKIKNVKKLMKAADGEEFFEFNGLFSSFELCFEVNWKFYIRFLAVWFCTQGCQIQG